MNSVCNTVRLHFYSLVYSYKHIHHCFFVYNVRHYHYQTECELTLKQYKYIRIRFDRMPKWEAKKRTIFYWIFIFLLFQFLLNILHLSLWLLILLLYPIPLTSCAFHFFFEHSSLRVFRVFDESFSFENGKLLYFYWYRNWIWNWFWLLFTITKIHKHIYTVNIIWYGMGAMEEQIFAKQKKK